MADLYKKEPAQIFGRALIGIVFILFLGFDIIGRGNRDKEAFFHITSHITGIADSIVGEPGSYNRKLRYIRMQGYPKTFELFIGKDFSDFSPAFEQLDKLKAGDTITVYFDETKSSNPYLNRLVQFINKGQTPYFIKGSRDIYVGYSAIVVCAGLVAYLLLLRKKGKII
ncbi:hypothetical protein [Hymenobacter sp.]|uniref:hypothetical protein n=1 Tax=Hymenobacter sp. TaxID=1898978 RepID=UPI00286D23D0|nr:hypothetical protein [Hymenobacter sp.]